MRVLNRPINILLIEDNPGDIRLTEEAFHECKININLTAVMDGVEAIDYLKRHPGYEDAVTPDLILLDLNLPKKDGREVLEEIKSNQQLKRIPVIVLTTSNAEQDILKTYNHHVNGFINKPVDFDRFFDIIQIIQNFWLSTAILPSMVY